MCYVNIPQFPTRNVIIIYYSKRITLNNMGVLTCSMLIPSVTIFGVHLFTWFSFNCNIKSSLISTINYSWTPFCLENYLQIRENNDTHEGLFVSTQINQYSHYVLTYYRFRKCWNLLINLLVIKVHFLLSCWKYLVIRRLLVFLPFSLFPGILKKFPNWFN